MSLNESHVEEAALEWFSELGYAVGHGPKIAPGEPDAERSSFGDEALVRRLQDAIERLNPLIPQDGQKQALRKVLRLDSPSVVGNNRAFHKMLRDGVEVEYNRADGSIAGDRVCLVDFLDPAANDWESDSSRSGTRLRKNTWIKKNCLFQWDRRDSNPRPTD